MSSFGPVQFDALEEGWSEPATSAIGVRGFPGGDNIALSLGGQREVTRTVACVFADRGSYVSFALLRGTIQTLAIDGWDSNSAALKESNPDPPWQDGRIKARAQFILT